MDFENRIESRVENIFYPSSTRAVRHLQTIESNSMSGNSNFNNISNTLRLEYDYLLYTLMEGNHMPFNRSIAVPQEYIESLSDSESNYVSLNRNWNFAGFNQQSCQQQERPASGPEAQCFSTQDQPDKQSLQHEQAAEPYYTGTNFKSQSKSYTENCEKEDSSGSPVQAFLGQPPAPNSRALQYSPSVSDNFHDEREVDDLQDVYDFFNTPHIKDNDGTVASPPDKDMNTSEKHLESVVKRKQSYPVLNVQEPVAKKLRSAKKMPKRRARKSANKVKEEKHTELSAVSVASGELAPSMLPLECLSPLERWKLHCSKYPEPKIAKGPVSCSHCNKMFPNMDECVAHLDQENIRNKNICPEETCKYSIFGFRVRHQLRRHICNDHLKSYNSKKVRKAYGRGKVPPDIKHFLSLVYVCKRKDCSRAFYRSDSLHRHDRLTHSLLAK